MINIIKAKKGMTLIEVLVGTILLGIVVMTIVAVITPMMMAYRRSNTLAEYNQVLDNVGNLLSSDLSQAEKIINIDIDLLDIIINGVPVVYTLDDEGYLLRNDFRVYHKDFYRSVLITEFSIDTLNEGITPTNYTITVTVSSEQRAASEISREYAAQRRFPLPATPTPPP